MKAWITKNTNHIRMFCAGVMFYVGLWSLFSSHFFMAVVCFFTAWSNASSINEVKLAMTTMLYNLVVWIDRNSKNLGLFVAGVLFGTSMENLKNGHYTWCAFFFVCGLINIGAAFSKPFTKPFLPKNVDSAKSQC